MNKMILVLWVAFTSLLPELTQAQCGIKANCVQDSIICGSTAQLQALTKWKKQANITTKHLSSVYFVNTDTGYVVGDSGTIMRTTNGGVSWTTQTSGTYKHLYSVCFINDSTGFVVGDFDSNFSYGTLLKTVNRGLTWSLISNGTYDFRKVFFLNENIGYIVGNFGVVLRTINGGNTWLIVSTPVSWNFSSVFFTSVDTGYISGYGGILRTYDGGNSWTQKMAGGSLSFYELYFYSGQKGYIAGIGGNGFLLKTEDGLNTSTILYNGFSFINAFYFLNQNLGYTVGNSESAYFKISNNDTIKVQSDAANGMKSVFFPTSNIGYAVGYYGDFMKYEEPDSFFWSPIANLSNPNIQNPFANPNQTETFYISSITKNGCVANDSVIVKVVPLKIEAGINKNIICGASIQLDSITSNYVGNGPIHYQWTPSIQLNSDSIANPISNSNQTVTYQVHVSTENQCIAVDSVTVIVTPLQIYAVIDTIHCGDSVQLSALTNYTGNDTLEYQWNHGNLLNDSTIYNPVAWINSPTLFLVNVKTSNQCTSVGANDIAIGPYPTPEICNVGVDSTNKNRVIWNMEKPSGLVHYNIFKETIVSGQYTKIGMVSVDSICLFTDTNSTPDVKSNKYKISATDSCGYETALSPFHKTMHLTINQGMGTTWNLIWEAYEGYSVSTYSIYRGTTAQNLQYIGSTSGFNTTYSDINAPSGFIYYQIEIIKPSDCFPDTVINKANTNYNTSRSNVGTNCVGNIPISQRNKHFKVFPNPSSGIIYFQFFDTELKNSYINLYTLDGRKIQSLICSKNTLKVDNLDKGMYLIQYISNDFQEIIKVVIE